MTAGTIDRTGPARAPREALVAALMQHGRALDVTIARLRAKKPIAAVGIAFAAQEVETVPITASDAPLDLVLTEREVIDFRGG